MDMKITKKCIISVFITKVIIIITIISMSLLTTNNKQQKSLNQVPLITLLILHSQG